MTGRRLPRPSGLVGRIMTAQIFVIAVGSITLALTTGVVAPGLFRHHLTQSGVTSAPVRHHAEEAFAVTVAVALTVAAVAALITAGVASWVLVQQVTRPIEQLAAAADAVAVGRYDVDLPSASTTELQRLADAYTHMATRLADTDAARSRLLSDLSHELRTPLATLTAYIDGLEDGVVPPNAQSFHTMRSQVSRLHRLTIDVREAASADEDALDLHLTKIDPAALAHAAIAAAAPRYAERGVALNYSGAAPPVPVVAGDPERLAQVLANLLDNALRHTPRTGHVSIAVHSRPNQVAITVTDDGTGIPADQLKAIFERFHRGDEARSDTQHSGSGLGLTIARAIIHAHRGTLTAANNTHGATFTIRLPQN